MALEDPAICHRELHYSQYLPPVAPTLERMLNRGSFGERGRKAPSAGSPVRLKPSPGYGKDRTK